ncbi:MAG: GTPase (G3E family) [Eubacterium sp.]|nr:GTPase (G3E family) [Eubacterium sp.]
MIKVDLVTGFLGSGKTTFIKEYAKKLVESGERLAIIVNDYGAINVDRLLLEETLGDMCHLEMVIGGDPDCTRRRLKTKLIAVGMDRYTRVIIEPSGIFDVDTFFDMIYEEPLERWYEIGSVITLVEAGIDKDLTYNSDNISDAAGIYLLASQIAKAGVVVLSKMDEYLDSCITCEVNEGNNIPGKDFSTQADNNISNSPNRNRAREDYVNHMLNYINESLSLYKCTRKIKELCIWDKDNLSQESFEHIKSAGYRSGEMVKLPVSDDNGFESLFFFHLQVKLDGIEDRISNLFEDKTCGNVIRLKGFIEDERGQWMEINATRRNKSISPISIGQDLFIVIGEGLNKDNIQKILE